MRRIASTRLIVGAAVLPVALGCTPSSPPSDPLTVDGVFFRGHVEASLLHDAETDSAPSLRPVVIGSDAAVGFCLVAPRTNDTSTWRATLELTGHTPANDLAPAARAQNTLCFDLPLGRAVEPGTHQLCGVITDTYDGRTLELPCTTFELRAADPRLETIRQTFREVLRTVGESPIEAVAAALDEVAARATETELPFYAVRATLTAAHFLRQDGSPTSLNAARRRLAELPAWLELPEATAWRAEVQHQAANLDLQSGRPRTGWEQLQRAELDYGRVADSKWLAIAIKRADWIARLGAPREGAERLRRTLAECYDSPCFPPLVASGRGALGWLILIDPDASEAELEEAGALLLRDLDALDETHGALERANRWVNIGFQRALSGHPPAEALLEARRILGGDPKGLRERELTAWAALAEAEHALRAGDPEAAIRTAFAIGPLDPPTAAAARALSLIGRAHLAFGDPRSADNALGAAMLLFENATLAGGPRGIDLGPSHRADDFYRAARSALDLGDPVVAWQRLSRLDRLSILARCGEPIAATDAARRDELLRELAALELPAAGAWRTAREPIRRRIQDELQGLARRRLTDTAGCDAADMTPEDRELDLRAFSVDGEVFFLHQADDGAITLAKRAALDRQVLNRTLRALEEAMRTGADDSAWRALYAPIATALSPPTATLRHETRIALYGILADLPLAALPTDGEGGSDWLGAQTIVLLRPPRTATGRAATETATGTATGTVFDLTTERGTFVVDPRGNLAHARYLTPRYRSLFDHADVLAGGAATLAGTLSSLERGRWLHLDAHGSYDPAFPELTRIQLADQTLDLEVLAERRIRLGFANLSGCDTGRSPTGAGSGRYGLGGWFVGTGTRWVIATRSLLGDTTATAFNETFYSAVAGGSSIVDAYRLAMEHLRSQEPASRWASLLLLEGRSSADPPHLPLPSAGGGNDSDPLLLHR